MRKLVALVLLLAVAACQSSTSRRPSANLASERHQEGTQSIIVAASPEQVRTALIASAEERGTIITRDEANMVIMENALSRKNDVLDAEFGPSDKGERVVRVRLRFSGSPCRTLVVQDLALLNNAYTDKEQSFQLPGDANTQSSLFGLKSKAEATSTCAPAV
ncbi:hypothetical protein [Polycladidibacter hongkongensis]|uniref:hypothetical protein n=1 Tax=Polycladidibacter hongkongensis TaxID=1647556 RepID=UPI00082A4F2D|nr:hypothetical protein [Pseudovibrio hongkongensis]